MLRVLVVLLLMADVAPYWETLPVQEWSDRELERMMAASPWVIRNEPVMALEDAGIFDTANFILVSAEPIRMAEAEMRRRDANHEDPLLDEYLEFLEDNEGRYIILAVELTKPQLLNAKETAQMEEKSTLRIGEREYRMVGHFPPSLWDPYLRLVFPRDVHDGDDRLEFNLYVPGIAGPFRKVEFPLKDLTYKGHPEM